MTNQQPVFKRYFRPSIFFIGVGIMLIGFGIVIYDIVWNTRINLMTFLIGIGAIGLGPVAMFMSFAQGCSVCREDLEEGYTDFPRELEAHVRSALEAAQRGSLDGVFSLKNAPPAPPNAAVSTLELEFCPKCRQLGRISGAQRAPQEDGSMAKSGASRPLVLPGNAVPYLLDMFEARRTAKTMAIYGGPAR